MKLSYYPGCTLKTKARGLEASAIASMAALGIELEELPRWNCCGTVYSLAEDDLMHHLASVRNLIRVKEQGQSKVVTLCAFCYNTLKRVNLLIRNDEEKRNTINNFMDEEIDYNGEVEVVHLLEVLRDDVGWEEIAKRVKLPLKELKVAAYYGCTLHRPAEAAIEPVYRRTALPELLQAIGATAIDFPDADTCCGSYQIVGNPDVVLNRTRDILSSAQSSGAEMLAVSCPLCESNLGQKQRELKQKENLPEIPIIYVTQLLALSLGLEQDVCQFELNYIDPRPLLQRKGLLPLPAAA
ncbi:MAG: CoB--CoM heterodisulfide reductase iron-sulfur subunit B family protein [Dehalococcoidia bacterium]|nr:CoB--CoM heterodisulfide reductase iron-sulfur subunit B family protein [Dehalococcoidia bacterium]